MLWETAIQVGLVFVVLVISVAGNGTVGALLIRFKKLRTIPNILIANMATVDLLNCVINMPTFILLSIVKVKRPGGPKLNTFVASGPFLFFQSLNVYSMVLLVLDRYGAIVHGMKYTLWKTRTKAYVAVGLVWFWAFACAVVAFIPLVGTNIQNGTTGDYRKAQFQSSSSIYAVLQIPLAIFIIGIFSVFTWREMLWIRKMVPGFQDISSNLRRTRQQNDMKAAKTMFMTFLAYVLSNTPVIVYAAATRIGSSEQNEAWLRFFARFGPFVASASNPLIYGLRNRRFGHALKQFWKDPCGKSPFQEMKVTRPAPKPEKKNPTGRFTGTSNADHVDTNSPRSLRDSQSNQGDIQGTPLPRSDKRTSDRMSNLHPNEETRPKSMPQQKKPPLLFTGEPNQGGIQGTPPPRSDKRTGDRMSNLHHNEETRPKSMPQQKRHPLLFTGEPNQGDIQGTTNSHPKGKGRIQETRKGRSAQGSERSKSLPRIFYT